jgi:hypothetical protein
VCVRKLLIPCFSVPACQLPLRLLAGDKGRSAVSLGLKQNTPASLKTGMERCKAYGVASSGATEAKALVA